jgi:hypothetical protein
MIDKRDIIVLDFIIDKILESNDLIWSGTLIKDGYLDIDGDKNREHEFIRLISVVQEHNVGKMKQYQNADGPSIERNENTLKFKEQGGFEKLFQDQLSKLEKEENKEKLENENIKLQNENFEYSKTIRDQESRIRDLEEQTKFFELIKSYWWFIGICIAIGVSLMRIWNVIVQ